VILVMAVNTAYVASSELLERVAHRYHFDWLIATNRRASLYRIHILNALMYTGIILLTRGRQSILAEMYAVSLLASFCINIGCLLIYRYLRGTKEIRDYHTSRSGTLVLSSSWWPASSTSPRIGHTARAVGERGHHPSRRGHSALAALRPEARERRRSDYPLEMVLALGEVDGPLHVYFRRPGEIEVGDRKGGTAFVMFFSPRAPIPPKTSEDHYRFPMQPGGVYRSITALLALLEEELEGGTSPCTSAGPRRRGSIAWRWASSWRISCGSRSSSRSSTSRSSPPRTPRPSRRRTARGRRPGVTRVL
jgi:hypothetical protein